MTRYRILTVALMLACSATTMHGQKARAYFDELYKAGGLDRNADEYVCFDDKIENENFFIFERSDTLKAALEEHNGLKSLPPGSRALLKRGYFSVRQYSRGVPIGDGEDQYLKDGESWTSDPFKLDSTTTGRLRFNISFETLRFKRSVETTKNHVTREAASIFGRCEAISPAVRQKAD